MKHYRIPAAAVVMHGCLGTTYAWSVLVLPFKGITAMLRSMAQLPFSLFYFIFPATVNVDGMAVDCL